MRNYRHIALAVLFVLAGFMQSFFVAAQDSSTAPAVTASSVKASIEAVSKNTDLTEEQIKAATELYTIAKQRLEESVLLKEQEQQFATDLKTAPETLAALTEDIEAAKTALDAGVEASMPSSNEPMREDDLLALEQELSGRESDLRALRAELEGYRDSLQALSARQINAPKELNEARTELGQINSALTEQGDGEADAVGTARRTNLRVRSNYRRFQIAALEREVAALPKRVEIVTARQTLADLKARRLSDEVQALQERTGQRRLNEALQLQKAIEAEAELYSEQHPVLKRFADRNQILATQVIALAASESDISRDTANTRSRQDIVIEDLNTAEQLSKLEGLDRNAGATLRRLGNQLASPPSIRASVNQTQKALVNATRQRLIAQESLRDLPLGRINADEVLSEARLLDPTLPDFSDDDIAALQVLNDSQRTLLTRIATESTARVTDLNQLDIVQKELLKATVNLQNLLDEKLLWIPSVPAIGLDWAPKIVSGFLELFSPEHLSLALNTFVSQSLSLWPLYIVFGGLIVMLFRARPALIADMKQRESKVGRVKEDHTFHTPLVILQGFLIAAPAPIFFLLLGVIFGLVEVPDPVIDGLENAFFYLAVFLFVFLTWRVWDMERSLFAAHFKMPKGFRRAVNKELKWFIPVVGTSSGLLALTTDLNSPDIYEGLSLFVFIFTALASAFFGFKVVWWDRKIHDPSANNESFLSRYKILISLIAIAGPLGAAIVAAAGYYETADELLWRFFTSGILLFLTYVVWGTIRRAIVVAQRQLRYAQALERRDAAVKARKEREEAEERGEEMAPPPLDTKEIDVSTITRQSSQLLNTVIIIAFSVLLWMNWSSLMPALSIFESFEVWKINTTAIDALTGQEKTVEQAVTLWNILQSLVIVGLTIIGARNLPGFLEIFVLNKIGVDPGTRYAVVTILGYIIVAAGVIIGFDRLGLQWGQLQFVAAGLSVGIGFGLQKIIANFVSGLIILFERPVRIGDYVTIGEQSGTVSRIKIRATTLADLDNREILIPNEALISERVTNWTLSNSVTRLVVRVGVAYGSDTDKARDLMLETIKSIPKVLETPPPQVLFFGFGDSSLDFEIRVFLRNFDERVPMTHTIHTEVNRALEQAGITIPFPQVDLNIMSQKVPVQVAHTESAKAKSAPRKKPKS
jgi:potassium efflux system protein